MPARAAMVVLTGVLAALLTSPVGAQPAIAMTGIAASAWISNGVLAMLGSGYFAHNGGDNALLHTWSLAVEEQFYVVFPLLVVALLWWTRRRGGSPTKRGLWWIAAIGVVSFALCVGLTYVRLPLPVGGILAFYSPLTRAWEFAAGAILALLVHRGWRAGRWAAGCLLAGALLLIYGLITIEEGQRFPGWSAAIPVAATVLLLIGSLHDAPGVRLLTNRPMSYIGDISYSWYLFHWPLIVFAASNTADGDLSVPATLAVTVAGFGLAVASYHWLEQPIRTRQRLARIPTPLLAALVIVPTMLASAGLYVGADKGWGQHDIQQMQAQLDHDQWQYQKVCQSPVRLTQRDMQSCRIEGDPDKEPLILVGDSNAGVYAELMVALAADLDRTVTIATVPSCTLSQLDTIATDGSSWLSCEDFYRSSMKWLATQKPSTVVMASGLAAVDTDLFGLRGPDGDVKWKAKEKQRLWRQALHTTYADLAAMGHHVVQVELVPHFLQWRASQCTMLEMLHEGVAACGAHKSRAKADE
ncbi:MAG: acyltransferase, partial [Nocardioidaceae bacterium]|nr:acyltransferase [Nocardioidaceae bacterium]